MASNAGNRGSRSGIPSRLAVWGVAAGLMVLPVLAIRGFGAEAWDRPGDFIFLGILLAGVGAAYELAARVTERNAYRAAATIAVAAALLNLWINLAIGIIGSEDNPANWLFAAVPAAAVAGSILARLRPSGMAMAMMAAAMTQVVVFAVALLAGLGFTGPITVFFAALWLISGWLFRAAARERACVGVVA